MSEKVDNFSTNVLIIGKSGVGKSSLLNYIFDQQLAETGSGKPVTKEEIFKYSMTHPSGMTVYVFDTWGLEADKADRWTKLIMDEVKAHDCADICDWFHTILYCISAKSARIEEFERQQIKLLLDAGNRVIVCLTHCDARNIEQSISALTAELCAIGLTEKDIIQTVSVSKKLLGSTEAAPKRGRDEILLKIQSNLWETVAAKLPSQLTAYANKEIDEWYEHSCAYARSMINSSNANSVTFQNAVMEEATVQLHNVASKIEAEYRKRVTEAADYYKKLCSAISLDAGDFGTNFEINIVIEKFKDNSTASEKAFEAVTHSLPVIGYFLDNSDIQYINSEFKRKFEDQADDMKTGLARYFYSLSEKMMKSSPQNQSDKKEKRVITEDIIVEHELEICNCELEFNAKIYINQNARLVLKNCDISVSPSVNAAICGNDVCIAIDNCRLTYHGSDNSSFLHGQDMDVFISKTELIGCYRLYNNPQNDYELDSLLERNKQTAKKYGIRPEYAKYCSTKSFSESGSKIRFIDCSGSVERCIIRDGSSSAATSLTIKNSHFKYKGTEMDNSYFLFECKPPEIENFVLENYVGDKVFSIYFRHQRETLINNIKFIKCEINSLYDQRFMIFKNCEFIDCKFSEYEDTLSRGEVEISDCIFRNCFGEVFKCWDIQLDNCKFEGGFLFMNAKEEFEARNCEFSNWSLREAIPKMNNQRDIMPIMFGKAGVIENCKFTNISINDAGTVGSDGKNVSEYMIAAVSDDSCLTIKNTSFQNVSVNKGIVRLFYNYVLEEEPLLPFLPPKRTGRNCNISLSVENCTGIDSYGKTN